MPPVAYPFRAADDSIGTPSHEGGTRSGGAVHDADPECSARQSLVTTSQRRREAQHRMAVKGGDKFVHGAAGCDNPYLLRWRWCRPMLAA